MTERSRHGLHVVNDGAAPAAGSTRPVLLPVPRRASLGLALQSVVLAVGGRLDADTSGALRLVLSVFTIAGGPRELVLDLSDVYAVDEFGMAPIFEADEMMRLRQASLWVTPSSATVAHFLADGRCDGALAIGPPPATVSGRPVAAGLDDDLTVPGQE